MSYDLSIMADKRYSQMVSKASLASFIASLPDVQPDGHNGFILDDEETRLMEIDLELVSEKGGKIKGEEGRNRTEINCLRLHIPYDYFREDGFEDEYLPTALAIAEFLGWMLLDEQTGDTWPPS